MKWNRWRRVGVKLLALAGAHALYVGLSGCVAMPQYPPASLNSIHVQRSLSGADVHVTNGADTDAKIEYARYDRDTGSFEIRGVEFISAQSKNQAQMAQWMDRYIGMMEQSRGMNQDNWGGVNQMTGTIVSAVTPLIGRAIDGQLTIKQMETMRPRLVDEAIALIRSGADADAVAAALPAGLVREIRARLPPASQPAEKVIQRADGE